MPVKTENAPISRAQLRRFCAVQMIQYVEIAHALGCSKQYISRVMREQAPASAVQLERIQDAITGVLWERERGGREGWQRR